MRSKADDTAGVGIPVGDAVLARALNAAGEPIDGRGPVIAPQRMVSLSLHGDTNASAADAMQETGISVIDLFAPIAHGGTVRLTGAANVGLLVTLGEWTQRIAARQRGCMVYVSWHEGAEQRAELLHVWEKQRTTPHIVTIFGDRADSRETAPHALRTAWTIARRFRDDGREVILAVEVSHGLPAALRQWPWANPGERGAITLALVDIEPADGHGNPDREITADSHLVFDAALARQKQYPAITALHSGARLLESDAVSARHRHIADAARALLARTPLSSASPLWQYLAQPYFIAEPFTGVPGVYRPLSETLTEVERLLEDVTH